ncbi:G-protein coupled receptor 183-A [Argonauta hians]
MDYNWTLSENITNVFGRHSWPMGLFKEFCPSALYIDRYVNAVWHIIGLFTNPISAIIWLNYRIRRNNSSAIYLAALSVTDFIFLWLHFINELQIAWGMSTVAYTGICELYYFIYMIPQYLAPIIVLGFTVERWIAVCKPFHKERFCAVKRAVYVVCGLIFLSTLLASAQIYIWNFDETHQVCTYRDLTLLPYNFTEVWNWLTEMTIFGGVPICVLIFNILVIREIRRITKGNAVQIPHQTSSSNNAASTITLISVSFYLIFTTLPVALVFVIATNFKHGNEYLTDDEIRADPKWNRFFTFMIVRRCIEGLCFSHYSCYFFVYCLTGPQFRKTFMSYFPNRIFRGMNNTSQGQYSMVTGNGRINNESCTTYV